MKRAMKFAGLVIVVLGATGLGLAQTPTFDLSLSAPSATDPVAAGTVLQYDATASLTTNGLGATDPGAQGWSLSVTAEGGKITSATTAGTIVDTLFDGGFNKTETTEGAGNEGAVSAVVLALEKDITLAPTGTVDILKLVVEVTVPQPGTDANGDPVCEPLVSKVSFVDGRQGSGQPVDNKITWGGATFRPTKGAAASTTVCPLVTKPLVFHVAPVDGEAVSGTNEIDIFVPIPAGVVPVSTGIGLRSDLDGESGAQGWSLSVETQPCFAITEATTIGTAVPDYYAGGFNKTQVVDPAKNGGTQGAVSAIVLSFTQDKSLPPKSDLLVLKLTGSLDGSSLAAVGDKTSPCMILPLGPESAGLIGAGQPVKTAVTVAGNTRNPGVESGDIRLAVLPEIRFLRGDANNDTKGDIADPIWIINQLFKQGPPAQCPDAADANDDGAIDTADAVYLIGYYFQAGTAPPAPFPDCGPDPTEDELDCPFGGAEACK